MTIVPLLLCLAQAAPSGTIAGQVVDGATHKPIVAAVVTLSGPSLLGVSTPDRPVRVVTNANGGFVFAGLAPGSYEVIATKGGYADGEPGRQRPGGDAPLVEIPAQRSSVGVVVPMWRYGVIAGSILDDAGEPVVNLQVRALRRLPGGRRYGNPLTTFTDDRGVYRIGGLVPGDYLVVASPPSDATVAARRAGTPADRAWLFPPVFYPAVSSVAQAQPISLTAGEERGGVDVHVDWTAAARVTGMILEEGAAVVEATVSLVPAGAELVPSNTVAPSTMTDEDGRFVLPAVVPGVYTLRASGGRGTRGWTRLPIAVPRQGLEDVVAVMKPPLKITARTRFDGASPTPLIGSVSFVAMPFALQPVDGQLEGV